MPSETHPDQSETAQSAVTGTTNNTTQRRGKKPPSGEPVIDRALKLLAAFDPTHRSLTLSALSRRANVPLSTTRRLAERLVAWGALEKDAAGHYVIGLRMYEVASLAPRAFGLRELAMPYIEDLYVVTREHVQLAVLEGSHLVLLERRSRPGAVEVEYRIGGHLPILSTALGLTLLAHLPGDQLAEVLANCERPDDIAASQLCSGPDCELIREPGRELCLGCGQALAILERETAHPICGSLGCDRPVERYKLASGLTGYRLMYYDGETWRPNSEAVPTCSTCRRTVKVSA